MKPNRRKLVRRSFIALVTGTTALALQACGGDSEPAASGNNSAQQAEEPSPSDDSDS